MQIIITRFHYKSNFSHPLGTTVEQLRLWVMSGELNRPSTSLLHLDNSCATQSLKRRHGRWGEILTISCLTAGIMEQMSSFTPLQSQSLWCAIKAEWDLQSSQKLKQVNLSFSHLMLSHVWCKFLSQHVVRRGFGDLFEGKYANEVCENKSTCQKKWKKKKKEVSCYNKRNCALS